MVVKDLGTIICTRLLLGKQVGLTVVLVVGLLFITKIYDLKQTLYKCVLNARGKKYACA